MTTYTGTVCTEAEIAAYAGELVDATGATEANRNDWVAQAQSFLSVLMKYNVVDNYAGLNANTKRILSEWAARYAAIAEIAYNMAGYTSRVEAEDMINVHWARMAKIEELLHNQDHVTYLKGS